VERYEDFIPFTVVFRSHLEVIRFDYRLGASFGIATFHSHEDADYAIYHLKAKVFHGQQLKARWSLPEENKKSPKPQQQPKGGSPSPNRNNNNNNSNKAKKERKPMMSLSHLTPRNEPSKAMGNTTHASSSRNSYNFSTTSRRV
jgi:RNA recognition motif-containing protein